MTQTHAANAATTTAKLAGVIIAAIVNAVNYKQMCSVIENWWVLLSSPQRMAQGLDVTGLFKIRSNSLKGARAWRRLASSGSVKILILKTVQSLK